MLRFKVMQGNITKMDTEAIVNAANSTLLGGGGVDGAIHAAAGPELLAECRALGGCPTGEARITRGFKLKARAILHAVGPIWFEGEKNEDALLASCYRHCFALMERHGLRSVAFPAISCGAYGFPIDRAAGIAVHEIKSGLERNANIERAVVCCFSRDVYDAYSAALQALVPEE
jgi:O-acetyl-ADP-ribose deacetylase (regulator of RNase III)